MLIRLISLIAFSFFISYWLWPLSDLYIYAIIGGVGVLVFGFPLSGFRLPFTTKRITHHKNSNVVELEEFRRKKIKSEKDQKQTGQKKY